MKSITIIICTYNGGARIERVLDNIYKQHGLRDYVNDVLVVNNNSSDETEHII